MHYLLTGLDPEDPSRKPFHFELVRTVNQSVPEYLELLAETLLRDKCDDRPASAAKVLEMLEAGLLGAAFHSVGARSGTHTGKVGTSAQKNTQCRDRG